MSSEDSPPGWQRVAIASAMTAIIDYRGKSPRKTSSGVPLITAKVVKGGRIVDGNHEYIDPGDYESWMRRGLPERGDVLITTEAPLGEVAQLDGRKVALAQRLIALRGQPDILDNTFLKYALMSDVVQDQLRARATGTTVLGIRQSELRKVLLPIPSLPEQRAIAHVLGTLDDKIELNRKMNETLEAMARAIFKSWFVDFDPVRAKAEGRQPPGMDPATAALFPNRLVDSALGPIPEGWRAVTLEKGLDVLETGSRPRGGVRGITSGVPSVGAESIVGIGRFDFSKTKYVPAEFYETMRRGKVQDHDVLLYKDGGRPGEFEPHVSMFGHGFPFPKFCINEHVYRMRAAPPITQAYLYFWLESDATMEEMRRKGTGVAIPGLNSTAVRSLGLLAPPAEVLTAFDEAAAPLLTRILANSDESRTLAAIRDALLPKLLSGEIRVPDAERFIEEAS